MSDIPYVDFRYGLVSEKLRRRVDLAMYGNSASKLENVVPLRTGGVVNREGLEKIVNSISGWKKIIPLTLSTKESYILTFVPTEIAELSNLQVYSESGKFITQLTHSYTEKQLSEIKYAQTYDMMVITHREKIPQRLTWNKDSQGNISFNLSDFVLKDEYTYYKDGAELSVGDKDYPTTQIKYNYKNFLNDRNYPQGVCFVANRLTFYNFVNIPYGIYMSKPFLYDDFQESVKFITNESNISSDLYYEVLKLQSSETSSKGTQTGKSGTYQNSYKKTETTVSTAGYYITTVTIVDEDALVKETYIQTPIYTFSKDSNTGKWTSTNTGEYSESAVEYSTEITKYTDITTDDCAIRLELASDRNETICWLGMISDSIIIGTTSSEWVMPSNITALSVQCSKIASYGSSDEVQCVYGMRNLFYVQSGGKKIRSMQYTTEGTGFVELTYPCPEYFENNIAEMVWQRIPEPRLYVRLKSDKRTLMVMCYDTDYGVNAWCKWTFGRDIDSICTVDTEDGQDIAVLYDGYICKFQDGIFKDIGEDIGAFKSTVITNNIDNSTYLAYGKKNYTIYADTNGTNFNACSVSAGGERENSQISCRKVNNQLSRIEAYTASPNNQGLRIKIEGNTGERFELLALIIDTEVNR